MRKLALVSLTVLTSVFSIDAYAQKIEKEEFERKVQLEEKIQLEEERVEKKKLEILEAASRGAERRLAEVRRKESVTFNSQDLRVLSNLTTQEMYDILPEGMKELAPGFIDAEKVYKVNALGLAGLIALESGWNTSPRAVNQNNLTGYMVYNDNSVGKTFSSKYECIMTTAKLLDRDYLNNEGVWHNGVSMASINVKYSADDNWHIKINGIANDFLQTYRNNNI
jgi:beta-N-acetylglucosaminidase